MKHADKGFTLLEILVALAITAVGIAAFAKAVGSSARLTAIAEERILANWVASNRLAEIRISRDVPTGSRTGTEIFGGRTWYIQETRSNVSDASISRLDVKVFADEQYTDLASEVFGFVSE